MDAYSASYSLIQRLLSLKNRGTCLCDISCKVFLLPLPIIRSTGLRDDRNSLRYLFFIQKLVCHISYDSCSEIHGLFQVYVTKGRCRKIQFTLEVETFWEGKSMKGNVFLSYTYTQQILGLLASISISY